MCVCGSVTTITRNCVRIDPHQTGFVGKGSDRLQLIKFWLSHAPGKGVCGEAKIFGCALLQPARRVCVSLSAIFISFVAIFGCTQFTQQLHPSAVRAAQLLTNYMSCRLVRWLAQESSTLLMPRLSSAAAALAPAVAVSAENPSYVSSSAFSYR